jgi:hypothetical protein
MTLQNLRLAWVQNSDRRLKNEKRFGDIASRAKDERIRIRNDV